MAWELGLDAVYYLLATLFQVSLAALIYATGPKKPIRVAFTLLLGLGGIQTIHFFLQAAGGAPFPDPTNRVVDTWILLTIAYLGTQFPTALGGQRGKRWARRAWITALAAVPVLYVPAHVAAPALYGSIKSVVHEVAFAAGPAALAIHLVPRWLGLDRGPLKTQTLYAGAGLAMSAAFMTGLRIHNYLDPRTIVENLLGGPAATSRLLIVYFVLVIVARFVVHYKKEADPQTLAFGGIVVGAIALGGWTSAAALQGATEFATQVGRPILFALAMLRFDLFRVPTRVRRVALPTTAVFLASLSFLILTALLDTGGFSAQQVHPLAGLGSTTLLALGIVLGHRWLRSVFLGPLRAEAPPEGRIDRYRLALERARAQRDGQEDLAEVRRQLDISDQEHAVLEHLLEQHVVLPTAAVRGAQPGDVIAGRYQIDRELGQGGHGRALLAWDVDQERSVVLKEVLHPWEEDAAARRRALEREVEGAAGLEADGLASVFDLVEEGPRTYLVREYIPGRTLADHVEAEGPMAPDAAMGLVDEIATAVDALHQAGLLHLDLKPENVILTDQGDPVIIDHGTIQQIRKAPGAETTVTLDGSGPPVGTLAWMAPEQVLEDWVDERTDVFALGALLYFLVTGRRHVEVEDRPRYEIEDEIVRGGAPRDVDGPCGALIRRCLAREPDERPSTIQDVRGHLRRSPRARPRDR